MRESWTDKRLDDFATHVDQRFDAVDKRLDGLERRMDDGFTKFDLRFDAMQQTLMRVGGGMFIALVGLIATQL